MLREIGVTLLVAGILTAAVLAALTGRRGLAPSTRLYGWDSAVELLENHTVAVYVASEGLVEVPSLEGYSFELGIGIQPSIGVMIGQAGSSFTGVNLRLREAHAYILGEADARTAILLYRSRSWDALLRLASSKAVARVKLSPEKGGFGAPRYTASIPLGEGKYWVLIVAVSEKTPQLLLPPKPQPSPSGTGTTPAVTGLAVDVHIAVNAVITPTPYQYFRALDIAALGAVLLGLDYYLNRSDYSEGRLAGLLSRIRGRPPRR